MNETVVCAVGNVATQPVHREDERGHVARFRLAATPRYWDREKAMWVDGHTNFFTVWTRRSLAANVAASLSVGDPVVVQGRLKVRADTRDGQARTDVDIEAVAVGHDLARGTSAFRRNARGEAGAGEAGGVAGAARPAAVAAMRTQPGAPPGAPGDPWGMQTVPGAPLLT
ncbi:single-stranded DNA-binding protein [Streptomyces abyssomicinicus]|uniref:single-stranded DNA-binding protein n=1 Tax=Streptomyces abyssomicinicus TaxID=574929 RepID=UPI0012500A2A|nr:single-stranded DNA-binding protein [Streptomyces abyssomicinicus]